MFQNILKEKKRYLLLIFLIIVSLIIILCSGQKGHNLPVLNLVSRFSFSLANKTAGFLTDIKSYFNLKSENSELKEENISLLNENKNLREAVEENSRLREMFNLNKRRDLKFQAAFIIGKDPTNFFNTFIIDKGLEDGIKQDMAVINNSGIIGKIFSSSWRVAKVILLIDANCNICAIDTRSRVHGVVSGTGGSLCIMKFISADDDVKVGDTIFSSGEGEIFPKGFLIGRVVKTEKTKDELMLDVYIKPAVKFSVLEEVFVVQ